MRRFERPLLIAWLVTVTALLAYRELTRPVDAAPAAPAAPASRTASFDVIDVHRINIVEPDGKPRAILSNSQRYPGAYFDGKEYPHPDRGQSGGLLFFNDDGTEAGGIAYYNDPKDKAAGAMLTMDQYNQNETMKLIYQEAHGKRAAGLAVFGDHPDKSLKPLVEASAALASAKTDADKQRLQTRVDQLAKDSVGDFTTRAFFGKEGDDAELILGDKQGNPRLRLVVDGAGNPRIELLDAKGKVTKKLP